MYRDSFLTVSCPGVAVICGMICQVNFTISPEVRTPFPLKNVLHLSKHAGCDKITVTPYSHFPLVTVRIY